MTSFGVSVSSNIHTEPWISEVTNVLSIQSVQMIMCVVPVASLVVIIPRWYWQPTQLLRYRTISFPIDFQCMTLNACLCAEHKKNSFIPSKMKDGLVNKRTTVFILEKCMCKQFQFTISKFYLRMLANWWIGVWSIDMLD